MCLSQLEILAKRNLRNFSYSTWHRACLATSFWVTCPQKGKSEAAWHLYRGDFLHPRAAPYLQDNASFPSHCSSQAGQWAACSRKSITSHYCFPWETVWPGYVLLSFSPQIHLPPRKWTFWSKSKRFGLQRKQKMSHSLKHFTWLLPPTTTTRDLTGTECSQRWGRSLAWCQWPFSPEKFRNSPVLICWSKVAEKEGIGRERRGKASQTQDRWPGDREESGQGSGEELCQKPERNDAQHHPLPAWQASPPKRGWWHPPLEWFPPANISLSDLKHNHFQPGSPYTRNVRSGNYPPPDPLCPAGLSARRGPEPTFFEGSRLSPRYVARCCLKATEPDKSALVPRSLTFPPRGRRRRRRKGSAVAAAAAPGGRTVEPLFCRGGARTLLLLLILSLANWSPRQRSISSIWQTWAESAKDVISSPSRAVCGPWV